MGWHFGRCVVRHPGLRSRYRVDGAAHPCGLDSGNPCRNDGLAVAGSATRSAPTDGGSDDMGRLADGQPKGRAGHLPRRDPRRPSPGATGRRGSGALRPAGAGTGTTGLDRPDARGRNPWTAPIGRGSVLERRKPRLLLRFDGWFLLRYAERQLSASLFQEPPRITRLEPVSRQPGRMLASATSRRKRNESPCATWAKRLAARLPRASTSRAPSEAPRSSALIWVRNLRRVR